MADLTPIEKLELERCFGMAGGYVLGFSNRTFAAFVLGTTNLDIDDPRYDRLGTSKANRLRAFWQLEPNGTVGTLIAALLEYRRVTIAISGGAPDQEEAASWERCRAIAERLKAFGPPPADDLADASLAAFDLDHVHAAWRRALKRREQDPEGAITAARSLLEAVCKCILDEAGQGYNDADDLPGLYGKASKQLNLAPSQHTEEAFRRILGGCHAIVETIGTLRNRIGDAHGRSGKPIRPAPRHAALAVNLAGAMATFLVDTWKARQDREG